MIACGAGGLAWPCPRIGRLQLHAIPGHLRHTCVEAVGLLGECIWRPSSAAVGWAQLPATIWSLPWTELTSPKHEVSYIVKMDEALRSAKV